MATDFTIADVPPVCIDLSRDLPKVRRHYRKLLEALEKKSCDYTAPCVIGAMVPPAKRKSLQMADFNPDVSDTQIGTLIKLGFVSVPVGQRRDVVDLQRIFDRGEREAFERKLKRLEVKYLESVSA